MLYSNNVSSMAGLPDRDGPRPTVSDHIPHIQMDQTSDTHMYEQLIERAFRDERVTRVASRASLPGAVGLTVAAELQARDGAMIVGREFAHIHQHPGAGSMHLRLPVDAASEVVAKGWGVWHPFAQDGSAPGMVMVFAPRDKRELDVVEAIIAASVDHAIAPV